MTRGVTSPWRAAVLAVALGGCAVGPNYHRPSAPVSAAFKEAEGWTPSHPVDALDKGAWWSMFNDPELDALERRVAVSNQTVKQFEAAYRQAHEIVAEARASYFPTIGAVAQAGQSKGAAATTATTAGGVASGGTRATRSYEAALDATWVPDLWGRIRRTVESNKALAQASAADLANARLSAQAALAQDYFLLRVLDEETRLYGDTVAGYQRLLKLTQDQVREGTQPQSAVLTAEAQLYGAQAAQTAVGVTRAQMEHAIAILVGVAPADLTIAPTPFRREVPTPPLAVPSTLLERRPDIAAAERRMASGNALIGVAVASYFPNVTLSGDYGSAASSLGQLFKASSTLWSFGADGAETLLDFGLRRAQVRAARAAYDQNVAAYRQTVLTAFQGVEDELAALRIYQQEQATLLLTEQAAQQTVKLDLDEYREGTVDYTTVIAAQASLLATSLNVLIVIENRLNASVLLVENLGGGWTTADLPRS
ncbi:MAG TPA: efflux transporter outer membrane subunit [Phenylobacterium sp.]|jgi:NodT family efflux transporter outer membrane factor (OMF) lipoprotein|uniref:efflux transporter outer membrane subunit n=1 Tax=Phenylobacterium sp. TaxID=1871053 RepID=UPI002CA8FAC5|nr:efflux transporter outer membrane subunit [Phenylobacterium sp.]HXA39362.1 efflux transporter outer membrane subunit [Phenylobacterium sp.]